MHTAWYDRFVVVMPVHFYMLCFHGVITLVVYDAISYPLPNLQDLYISRVTKRAKKVTLDPSHPAHSLFELLPSGWHYRSLSTKTAKYKNSFPPRPYPTWTTHELMNEWCIYIVLYCVLLYTQSALQSCGGSLLNHHQCAASTWMMWRLPQDNGASALTTHQLQVEEERVS